MQGKGIIRFFLILLTIVCLFQYLYLLPTRKVEKAADNFATAATANITDEASRLITFKAARAAYLDSMSSEPVIKLPLLGTFSYEKLKQQQIALGLDLKGGISSLLQINLKEFLISLSGNSKDPAFNQALDNAQARMKNSSTDFITVFVQEWNKVKGDKKLAPIFSRNASFRDQINFESSDDAVISLLRAKSAETVDLTFKRLKDRIDKLGVVQPNVSLDKSRDLILVELPGIDNPERARNYLQSTAKLEFWNVYRVSDPGIMEAMAAVDQRLASLQKGDTTLMSAEPTMVLDSVYTPVYDSLGNVIDSTVTVREVPASMNNGQGPLLSMLDLNYFDGQTIRYPFAVLGVANKNKINAINALLQDDRIKSLLPQDLVFMWSSKPTFNSDGNTTDLYELYGIRLDRGKSEAPLQGDRIVSATSSPDPMTNEVAVTLRMDNQGAKIWSEMTTKAAQDNNREIAIALDNEVVSAPRVNEAITTGDSRISGNFSIQEGQDLANILQIGKLPASTTIIQEYLVGPTLGKENIQKSVITLLVSLLVVIAFMIAYYAGSGVIAVIALLANLFFIFGSLSSLGTVLTLPGIAGIVLTIGMAVDANVIIYERAREELRAGKSLRLAISDGFKYSYSAIIDANVTTILTALVLAYFGLGPIKGFAITLLIGVVFSFFTAVMVGRLIIDWWVDRGNTISFWTEPTKNQFANLNIDWLGKRKKAYIFSTILMLAGIICMFTRGFEFGVDFKGGYSYNIQFDPSVNVDPEQLRDALTASFEGAPIVKAVDIVNTYNVTTSYRIDDPGDNVQSEVMQKLFEGVNAMSGGNLNYELFKQTDYTGTHISSFAKVGPNVADDIKKSSIYAGVIALLLIFFYILIRFNKWQFSLGAILALFHDAMVVLICFTALHGILPFSLEVDQNFIAAILTVIGYSINDTVVIFDRIRENLALYPGKSRKEILNMSINSTMSRTIITALTVFLVVASLLFFGGSSIKGFAFAILVGLISGTYSTVFIAAPILADLGDKGAIGSEPKQVTKPASVK